MIWKDIKGYEGKYQVNDEEQIRSIDRYVKGKNGRFYFHRGVILKHKDNGNGYETVTMPNSKYMYVHRIVAFAFPEICGEWFEGAEVDHIDGNTHNNKPQNLRWVTRKENCNNPIWIKHRTKHTEEERIALQRKYSMDRYNRIKGTEEYRAYQRENMRRWRARQKALNN